MRCPTRVGTVLIVALAVILTGRSALSGAPEPPKGGIAGALIRRQFEASMHAMNRPFEPFRIIGNLYYVGASDVASFLITTPEGHVLIDTGFDETVPYIRDGIRKLGFRYEDVKILLNTHAHLDHAGGHALVRKETGATIVMSAADAALLSRGGKGDFLPLGDALVSYPPASADRIIADGESVRLGGLTLTPRLTPGHTKGCTTWTFPIVDSGKAYRVVVFGSTTLLPGIRLKNNPAYPTMADDFAATFLLLKSLPCDVFLAPHGLMYGLDDKARRLASGASPNPFIDPEGYRAYVDRSEKVFLDRLARETP